MCSQIKFCSGKKNEIQIYVFLCFIMTVHQDHVLRKIGMSCDACRSFAFPVMLEETLGKTLSAERQNTKNVFFLQIAFLQAAPLEMLFVFFDVRFDFVFSNVRSGLPLEDIGFRNIWRCDSALAWIACYLIDVRQLHD